MHSLFGRKLLLLSALVIAIWLGIALFIYRAPTFQLFPDGPAGVQGQRVSLFDEIEACKSKGQKLSNVFWRKVDLNAKEIPESVSSLVTDVVVKSNFTTFQNSKIHYLHSSPKNKKNLSVLLLHGLSYSSATWNKLQTIQHIASFGFEAVAIDLPGYGDSPAIQHLNSTEFLNFVVDELNLKNTVLISPSMSGKYSVPYLLNFPSKLAGFVPVSPVASNLMYDAKCKDSSSGIDAHHDQECQKVLPLLRNKPPHLECIKVPTLVVFGENDRGINSALLCSLPNSQGAEIPDGRHAAYLSNPALWHRLLYNFLDVLSETLPCT